MAEFPALPFFTDAYLADTRHLTTEEHGAYLLLLICAWRTRGCALKDDDKTLGRIVGLSPTRWRRLRPVLQEFFTVSDGLWRQKKLTNVYAGVAARVARNKLNGAKGGRAVRPARPSMSASEKFSQSHKAKPKPDESDMGGHKVAASGATKTKTKEEQASAFDASAFDASAFDASAFDASAFDASAFDASAFDASLWRTAAAHACGQETKLDDRVLRLWYEAGVCTEADMVPTITAVRDREAARTGQVPRSLAYYRDAVLDAAEVRLSVAAYAATQSAKRASKIAFDPANADHWQQLLGDPMSRFRGDYMAQHWFVPNDHPTFLRAELGANPRLSAAPHIPIDIHQLYGSRWGWLPLDLHPQTRNQ